MQLREVVAAGIAVIVILAFVAIVLVDVIANRPVSIPDAMLVLVSLISGVYFGQHAATNGAFQAGQAAAATAAQVVAAQNVAATK